MPAVRDQPTDGLPVGRTLPGRREFREVKRAFAVLIAAPDKHRRRWKSGWWNCEDAMEVASGWSEKGSGFRSGRCTGFCKIRQKEDRRPALKRFEREAPNLWQMDFKGEYQYAGGWCYPLSIVDDHSRYAVPVRSPALEPVCVVRTFEVYGVPEALLMDHGTPWWSTKWLWINSTECGADRARNPFMFQRSGASANSGEGGTIPLCLVPGRAASRTQGWVQWKALLAALRSTTRFGLMRRWRRRCRPRVTNPAEKPTKNTPLAAWSRD